MRYGTVLYNLHCGIALTEQCDDESSNTSVLASATGDNKMTVAEKLDHTNWLKSKASKLVFMV